MSEIRQIAVRIKELREIEGFTVEQFAKILDMDPEIYKNYESGETDMPISFLYEVANRLKVDLTTLVTGTQPKLSRFSLVRSGHGLDIKRSKQYKYKTLAYNFQNRMAEVMLVTVDPQPEDAPVYVNTHPGQEIDYILEGTVVAKVGDHEMILNAGDTLYYDSSYPHGMKAVGDTPAKCLTILMESKLSREEN